MTPLLLRPAAAAAIGLSGGILTASLAGAVAAGAATILAALWARRRGVLSRPFVAAALAAAAWFSAGAFRAAAAFGAVAADHYARLAAGDGPVRLRARVGSAPRLLGEPGAPRGYAAVGEARAISRDGALRKTSGAVRLFLPPDGAWAAGQMIEGTGRLAYARGPTNPGQPDFGAMDRRAGILASVSFAAADVAVVRPSSGSAALRERIRGAVATAFARRAAPETAAFLSAILLGLRDDLPRDWTERFRESGTVHFLAVSGLHLLLLLSPAALLLRLAVPWPRPRAAALIALGVGYAWLVGFTPSISRACVLWAVYWGADLVGRPRDFANALAVAFCAILVAAPHQIFLPGFQLSFAACGALAYLAPALPPRAAAGPPARSRARRWASRVGDAIRLSAAAWLATAPLVLWHFNILTPAAVVGNLLLSPVVAAALSGGAALAVLDPVLPAAGAALGRLLDVAAAALSGTAGALAALPGGCVYVPAPPLALVATFLACLAGIATPLRRTAAVAAAAVVIGWGAHMRLARPEPGFVVLDVGQGLCAFLTTDAGRTVMYDCGSYGGRDPVPAVVAPALWARGVRRIDVLVLSHPHADHANGVGSLLKRFSVSVACVGPAFGDTPAGRQILADLAAVGVPCRAVAAGDRLPLSDPDWTASVLFPPAGAPPADPNDRSLVTALTRADGLRAARAVPFRGGDAVTLGRGSLRILLTGDLEEEGIGRFLASAGDAAAAEVVVIPHHGSATAAAAPLAAAARAAAAVNPARRGFASPATLAAFRRAGARVYETWRDGAVVVAWETGR